MNQAKKFIWDKNTNSKILDVKSHQKDSEKSQFISISRKICWIVFSFIISLTIFMGLDQGIL